MTLRIEARYLTIGCHSICHCLINLLLYGWLLILHHWLEQLQACDVLLLRVCEMTPVPLQKKSVVNTQEFQGLIYGSLLKQREHKGGIDVGYVSLSKYLRIFYHGYPRISYHRLSSMDVG